MSASSQHSPPTTERRNGVAAHTSSSYSYAVAAKTKYHPDLLYQQRQASLVAALVSTHWAMTRAARIAAMVKSRTYDSSRVPKPETTGDAAFDAALMDGYRIDRNESKKEHRRMEKDRSLWKAALQPAFAEMAEMAEKAKAISRWLKRRRLNRRCQSGDLSLWKAALQPVFAEMAEKAKAKSTVGRQSNTYIPTGRQWFKRLMPIIVLFGYLQTAVYASSGTEGPRRVDVNQVQHLVVLLLQALATFVVIAVGVRYCPRATYYAKHGKYHCPCPFNRGNTYCCEDPDYVCTSRVSTKERYLMKDKCAKRYLRLQFSVKTVASKTAGSGRSTKRTYWYYSWSTIGGTCPDTGEDVSNRCNGEKIFLYDMKNGLPFALKVYPPCRLEPDYEEWLVVAVENSDRQRDLSTIRDAAKRDFIKSLNGKEKEAYFVQQRKLQRECYSRKNKSMKFRTFGGTEDGTGKTDEYVIDGIINEHSDALARGYAEEVQGKLQSVQEQYPGAFMYIAKGTCQVFGCRELIIPGRGELMTVGYNIEGVEHLRWLIHSECNNLLLTGEGSTIPLNWFLGEDPIIKTEIIWYKQTNGAELAFNIEGDLIDYFRNSQDHGFGRDYANQGRFRGNGNVSGVHCTFVIVITNFLELLKYQVIGFNSMVMERCLKAIRRNVAEQYLHIVEPDELKYELIMSRRIKSQIRYDVRRQRATEAEDAEYEGEHDEEAEDAEYEGEHDEGAYEYVTTDASTATEKIRRGASVAAETLGNTASALGAGMKRSAVSSDEDDALSEHRSKKSTGKNDNALRPLNSPKKKKSKKKKN